MGRHARVEISLGSDFFRVLQFFSVRKKWSDYSALAMFLKSVKALLCRWMCTAAIAPNDLFVPSYLLTAPEVENVHVFVIVAGGGGGSKANNTANQRALATFFHKKGTWLHVPVESVEKKTWNHGWRITDEICSKKKRPIFSLFSIFWARALPGFEVISAFYRVKNRTEYSGQFMETYKSYSACRELFAARGRGGTTLAPEQRSLLWFTPTGTGIKVVRRTFFFLSEEWARFFWRMGPFLLENGPVSFEEWAHPKKTTMDGKKKLFEAELLAQSALARKCDGWMDIIIVERQTTAELRQTMGEHTAQSIVVI